MSQFPLHTQESAPAQSQPILEGAVKKMGFLPNLFATFADSPAVLEGYTTLSGIFAKSSFDATEQQVILLTASFENGCEYCMSAHSTISTMQGIDSDVITALRDGAPIGNARLDALATFTRLTVQQRGWVEESDVKAFLDAGFQPAQVLEVFLGVSLKVLSNYTNHVAQPPLDEAFQKQAWSRPAAV